MGKIEFKTQVIDGLLKVPEKYRDMHNAIVNVVLEEEVVIERRKDDGHNKNLHLTDRREIGIMLNLAEIKEQSLDFSEINIDCFKNINPLEYQRNIRDGK
jgi:hypothetical protein